MIKDLKENKATYSLIIINILFALFIGYLSKDSLSFYFSLYLGSSLYTLITNMFIHAGIIHLGMNMVGLYFLGKNLEKFIGSKWFLIIYFISGIVASLISILFIYIIGKPIVVAGASGAIFGMYAFYSYYFNNSKLERDFWINVVIYHLIIIVSGLNIAWYAHAGGILSGLLFSKYFNKNIIKLR